MNKIAELSIALGILAAIQPTTMANSQPKKTISNPNQMVELSTKWGFEPTTCNDNIAEIKHDVSGEVVCVVPNETVGAGKFIYDSTNNKLRVDNPVTIAEPAVQEEVYNAPQEPDPRLQQVEFRFNNSYDYGACLDAILLAYEGRKAELEKVTKNDCATNILSLFDYNLSQATTRQLIELADQRATEILEDTLYPSLGLRRRVAINLGYVYDIDRNNEDILKYLESEK